MEKDIAILKMIEVFNFSAYISGVQGIQHVEMEPVPLGVGDMYISGFKIKDGQPLLHVKHIKSITINNDKTIPPLLMTPDLDTWVNAVMMDEELILNTISKLYTNLRNTTQLHVLNLTYETHTNGQTKEITHSAIYQNKGTACKDAISFRKKQPCHFKFISITKNTNGKYIYDNTTQKTKVTDLEFATAALE